MASKPTKLKARKTSAPPAAPGRVGFTEGSGELSKLEITTAWSRAEVYLHGAHVTHFQREGEPPVLFMSQLSRFEAGIPIRGGIPIVFPWFGPRESGPTHGFARTLLWEPREISSSATDECCCAWPCPIHPAPR